MIPLRRLIVKIRALIPWIALAALGMAPGAFAQTGTTGAPPAGSAPTKIAILNVRTAIVQTAEGKAASADLQAKFAPQQTEMDNIRKQIDDIEKQLSAGANTLSEEEKARKERAGQILGKQLQHKQDEYTDNVTAAQSDAIDAIGRKMMDVIDRYARENGYGVVIDSSGQTTPVLYRAAQLDITDAIVKLYDTQYPARAGAAPKPPGTPPATNPPAKRPGGGQ
jgi:outer membrane protein